MKRVLTLLAISAMALPAISAAAIDTNLKYGARGTEVSELQEFLIDKGFLSGTATGNFYSLTLKAVIAYQTSVGLPVTGFVGPMTRNVINQQLAGAVSTQAEVTETGTTTPPLAESPIDLLKKQIALLMQQMQVIQGQATTQNQILQNQQAQQAAQNQQAQQTQQQLAQIGTNTTPPAKPVSAPNPVEKPAWKITLEPISYLAPVKVSDPGTGLVGRKVAVFRSNSWEFNHPNITVEVRVTQSGMDLGHLGIKDSDNNVRLIKESDYIFRFPSDKSLIFSPSGSTFDIELTGLPIGDGYPDYAVVVTFNSVSPAFGCPTKYSSCEFPALPVANTIVINPR